MNLIIDLDSEKFVAPSTSDSTNFIYPLTQANARRRESFPLTIQFVKNGALTDIPFTASLAAVIKKQGDYGGTALCESLTFTKTGSGATAVYSSAFSLFTTPMEELFAAEGGVEPPSVDCDLEVQWWSTDETHITEALALAVANCFYRSTDTVPETTSPAPVPVTIGTTTTGSAGSSASVTNSGTSSAAVLNFTIPKGDTGPTGPSGAPTITDFTITGDTTINAPTGTPADGQRVIYRIKQDGTGGHTVTLNSAIVIPSGSGSPSFNTTANKYDLVGLMYSSASSAWILASFNGAY